MLARRCLAAIAAVLLCFSSTRAVWAETAPVQPQPVMCCNPTTGICVPATSATNVQAATTGHVDLDLSSTAASIQVTGAAVNVQVTGAPSVINPGDYLTPAQFVAVHQFLAGGPALNLSSLGNAVGGTFSLNSALSQAIGNLVVPQGVTAVHDFGASSALNLAGTLTNSGNLYALSSNAATTTASITAANILNQQGALLSSVLPSGGLPGFSSAVAALNLNLNAINNIVNQGVIASSGNLSMTAGGSITNQASITAAQNVALMSAIGSINNSGLIAATTGSINITSQTAQALAINNMGGTLQALNGSFNAATASLAELGVKPSLSVTGGDLLAKELKFTSEHGPVNLDVQTLDGRLSIAAGEAHVTAATPNLTLGDMHITGDPTFYNTGGDVQISGDLTFNAQNLALIASGNIYTILGAGAIDTSSNGTGCCNAGSILMIAGAVFTSPAPGTNTQVGPDSDTALTISGGSATGGYIDLSGSGSNPITSLNTTAYGAGGTVTLIAYGTAGTINVPVTIQTATSQNTPFVINGNVTVIAGASSGTAIQLAGINSNYNNNASTPGGNTLNPQSNNGEVIIASATPLLFNPANTTLTYKQPAGSTVLTVGNPGAFSVTQQIAINPTGANGEVVTVTNIGSGTITVTALVNNHTPAEALYVPATSATIPAGAGSAGNPILSGGAVYYPGTLANGNMTLGAIAAGGNITVATGGSVTANGNMSLSQNPQNTTSPFEQSYQFQVPPTITINAGTLIVSSGVNINSTITLQSGQYLQICGQSGCQNTVGIISPTINNFGTISGNLINIITQNLANNGNITGTGNNAFINIQSSSENSLSLTSLSNTSGMSVPAASAIAISAADNQTLTLTGSQLFNTGAGSVLIFSAQGGSIVSSAGAKQTISGSPIVIVSTPTLTLNNGSELNAPGATMAFNSGYTQNPLNISLVSGATAGIMAGTLNMRPTDGQNINFQNTGSSLATLNFNTSSAVTLATNGGTSNYTIPLVKLTFNNGLQVSTNPSAGIFGVAFEPYVGGLVPGSQGYTLAGAYTYAQVLVLLAPVAASQQFQIITTYSSLYADSTSSTGYSQLGASALAVPAAKLVGMRVSAGVGFAPQGVNTALDINGTQADINYTLAAAQKYGNVVELVVGNECIDTFNLAGPGGSITNLGQLITFAQDQLPTYGFTTNSLPVTTRQRHDLMGSPTVLTIMQSTVNVGLAPVLNSLQVAGSPNTGYVYANIYPYYDSLSLTPGVTTQSQFNNLVQTDMSTQYSGLVTNMQGAGVTTINVLIGETGWASNSTSNGAPQANLQFATWYYPAMQTWSATTQNLITQTTGVPIHDYFEAYDEPNKFSPNPVTSGEPYFGIWTGSGTNAVTGVFTLNSISQKFTLPLYQVTTIQGPLPPSFVPPTTGTNQPPSFNPFASGGTNNTTATNEQIGTRISTDYTQAGNQPGGNNESTVNIMSGLQGGNETPYGDLGDGEGGWQTSGDGSVWSCVGCIGSGTTGGGMTQNATRVMQKTANFSDDQEPLLIATAPSRPQTLAQKPAPASTANSTWNGPGKSIGQTPSGTGKNAGSYFDLPKGMAVFNAKDPVVVGTQEGLVHIEKGSLAFVIETGNDVTIYNLHDKHKGGIQAVVAKRVIVIPPGKQLVLTRVKDAKFANINPGSKIAYRNPKPVEFGGGVSGFLADFSLPSAIANVPPLKNMLKSTKPEDRKVAHQLLKNAVIMADVYGVDGAYKTTQ